MKTPGGITGKGFVKGDPRCNRNGRPKGFDELSRVAQQIVGEDVIWADGSVITRAELILRRWSRSKNPKLQKLFIEIAFGPVPPTKSRRRACNLEPCCACICRMNSESDGHQRFESCRHPMMGLLAA